MTDPAPPTTSPLLPSEAAVLQGLAWTPAGMRELVTVADVQAAYDDPAARLWVDIVDADQPLINDLATVFAIHPLVAEDIHERNQRAKVELTGSLLHIVMFALLYDGGLDSVEVDLVLGRRFLLSAHEQSWDPHALPQMRRGAEVFLAEGTDYLLWAVVDGLVDGYFPVFDKLGDAIDDLQDDVIRRPTTWVVERLFAVRRDLLLIRHAVSPQREIFNQLTNRDQPLVAPERILYFRDVYDHLIRLTDELDSYRELVSTTLDAYLSTVNNNLSDVMKRLTSVTVILAGIGAVAGIFGMSEAALAFQQGEGSGFWIVALVCVIAAGLAAAFFRRIGWL
ncbi:MAG: magnesium transporter CorA family protein [Candidatus Limnocylindrales bacterium]